MKYLFKILLIPVALMILLSEAHAQKNDKEKIQYTYLRLPLQPLPDYVKTYSIVTKIQQSGPGYKVKVGSLERTGKYFGEGPTRRAEVRFMDKTQDYENKYLALTGYTPVARGGEVVIQLSLGQLGIIKSKTPESTLTVNGKRVDMRSYEYVLPATLQVLNADGKIILEKIEVMNRRLLGFLRS